MRIVLLLAIFLLAGCQSRRSREDCAHMIEYLEKRIAQEKSYTNLPQDVREHNVQFLQEWLDQIRKECK
jgi:uncharacterized lipoprotein YajG